MPSRIFPRPNPGDVFGHLTVLDLAPNRGYGLMLSCRCVCGKVFDIREYMLVRITRSCGCVNHHKHGRWGTKEYRVWTSAKQRCDNPHLKNFKYYGARGITMCQRWRESFKAFMEDIGTASGRHDAGAQE